MRFLILIWNINLTLRHHNSKDDNENLEFKDLVKKTVMLFIVLGVLRKQSLCIINVNNFILKDKKVICS